MEYDSNKRHQPQPFGTVDRKVEASNPNRSSHMGIRSTGSYPHLGVLRSSENAGTTQLNFIHLMDVSFM